MSPKTRRSIRVAALAALVGIAITGWATRPGPVQEPTFTTTVMASPVNDGHGVWMSTINVTIVNHTDEPQAVNHVAVWFVRGDTHPFAGPDPSRCPWFAIGEPAAQPIVWSETPYMVIPAHSSRVAHTVVSASPECTGLVPDLAASVA